MVWILPMMSRMKEDNTNDITGHETRSHSRRPSSGSHYHHLYKTCEKRRFRLAIIALGLGGLLVVLILIWVMASLGRESYNGDRLEEKANTLEKQERLEKLQSEIEGLKHELAQLVQGRIPRLLPIEFDVTIPLNQDYLRNISFILSGISENRSYEFHVVMHNEDSVRVEPNANLFLFDELGIQVGKTHLSNEHTTSETVSSLLRPGETRSYFNRIKLDRETYPRYFLVDVK